MVNAKYYVKVINNENEKVVMVVGLEKLLQFVAEIGMAKDLEKCIHDAGGEIVEPGNYDDGYNIKVDLFTDSKVAIVNIY